MLLSGGSATAAKPLNAIDSISALFGSIGDLGFFMSRVFRQALRPPFEVDETIKQLFEIGWRSLPLIIASGFAFGIVLTLETRAEMEAFGAVALIPQAVSYGLIKDVGPVLAALLMSGRAGAGIGAELGGMRVTEQIDALECIGVDSFKYLVVTRVTACVIALPLLTTIIVFAGIAGGIVAAHVELHMTMRAFMNDAFTGLGWSDYIPPIVATVVFGFIIGVVSSYLGYNAAQGATGVGRASTRSVVLSSLLVILFDVIIVKFILFWFP